MSDLNSSGLIIPVGRIACDCPSIRCDETLLLSSHPADTRKCQRSRPRTLSSPAWPDAGFSSVSINFNVPRKCRRGTSATGVKHDRYICQRAGRVEAPLSLLPRSLLALPAPALSTCLRIPPLLSLEKALRLGPIPSVAIRRCADRARLWQRGRAPQSRASAAGARAVGFDGTSVYIRGGGGRRPSSGGLETGALSWGESARVRCVRGVRRTRQQTFRASAQGAGLIGGDLDLTRGCAWGVE